ncbi:hypothetical protein SAMN05421595_0035 [Austwickia chelonae]|uniref:ABC transporter permease protein n=1 Tax=Austwickia chelonae NBRC 105200 TaxID=1184607 RepID=K6VPZ8_9MICO|nr:ABC transporter permease [Austwickia chelonae]GAB78824.1 hypothetical protein AUCHE_17_00360 [Austwickia chelonae NBRC 105200]SEV84870.1 hypothetical protein SAMN05421595_0035 [Austwickia chelonae]
MTGSFNRHKPNPWTAWKMERAKGRTGWFLLAAVLVGLMGQALGMWNYLKYRDEYFASDHLGWIAIWVQGSILVTTTFLPIVYVITQAAVASSEFEYRGWLRIVSTDSISTAITGKLLYALELSATGMGIYLTETVITGFAVGLSTDGLGPIVARALVAVVGAWSIGAVMMFIGVLFTSFPLMTLVGVAGTIAGLAMTVAGLTFDQFIPFSLITAGMGARATRSLLEPGDIVTTLVVAAAWIVLCKWGTQWQLQRKEW